MTMTDEHKTALAEGRKRAADRRKAALEDDGPRTVQATYIPLSVTDPNVMTWNGVTFRANVPVELSRDNPAHSYLVPKQIWRTNAVTGRRESDHSIEELAFMGDVARGNPSFEVDGKRTGQKTPTRHAVPPPGEEWAEGHRTEISHAAWDGHS